MNKFMAFILLILFVISSSACSNAAIASTETTAALQSESETEQILESISNPITVVYDSDDLDTNGSDSEITYIQFEGNAITFEGDGAGVNGTLVTITSAGTYNLSGTLNNGQVIVDTQDAETVVLVLDGVELTSTISAPIYAQNAEKTVITLVEGTANTVTDGTTYLLEDSESDEPNAAIFSKDDLTINGEGSLTVNANYNHGIVSKDDLKITGGTITVNAVNDGIKGRDSISVKDGTISINAGGDGMQSNNDEDAEEGFVLIEDGTFNITAGLDGIQAQTRLEISGGNITISSGNTNNTYDSAKGLKAGVNITTSGGAFDIDAQDDAIHSNDSITIDGGDIVLASGDDGIHADSMVVINGGNLTITESYEGIESAVILINDGNIHLTSSDDGINVSTGDGGGMGHPGEFVSSEYYLEINGGYIFVDAAGDGLDINGVGRLNEGKLIINGPIMNMNGALDVGGMLEVNGGFLVAVGSAGMAQSPSIASTQYSALITLPIAQPAGSIIHIEDQDGEDILTFVPTKAYETVVISSPNLENGLTYTIYVGGNSTGSVTYGLYSDGIYTAGTEVSSFTITSIVTGESTGMGGIRGGGRPGGGRP
jgi:hypothetical protein